MDPSIFILIAVLAVAVGVYFLNRNSNTGGTGSNTPAQPYEPFPGEQARKSAPKKQSSKKKVTKKKATKKKATKKKTGGSGGKSSLK